MCSVWLNCKLILYILRSRQQLMVSSHNLYFINHLDITLSLKDSVCQYEGPHIVAEPVCVQMTLTSEACQEKSNHVRNVAPPCKYYVVAEKTERSGERAVNNTPCTAVLADTIPWDLRNLKQHKRKVGKGLVHGSAIRMQA